MKDGWSTKKILAIYHQKVTQYPHIRFDMKEIKNKINGDCLKQPPCNTLCTKMAISHLCPSLVKASWLQASITIRTFRVFQFHV
jgi:hypothetical protein